MLFGYLVVFLFGLIIGSFLNAVIWRLQVGESALHGRSYCPHCRHQLHWKDLVPLFSFVYLRGKCRYCKNPISGQYPVVELITALVFLLIFHIQFFAFGQVVAGTEPVFQWLEFAFLLFVASALIVIFVYDLKHYLIPDVVLFPTIGVVAGYRVLEFLNIGAWSFNSIFTLGFEFWDFGHLLGFLFAALVASGFFLFIFLISKGAWMGFGDVKLAVLMGLILGFPYILVALFIAFLTGAIIGVALMSLQKKGLKSEIPFGPFLIIGTFIALFWGEAILNWYWKFVLFL